MTGQRISLLLCCAAAVLSPTLTAADIGGRGRPMTPYRDLGAPGERINLERIKCEMLRASVLKSISNYEVDWPKDVSGGLSRVGLAYVDAARAKSRNDDKYAVSVFHHFAGTDSNGKAVQVEFNRLESFKIVALDGNTARIQLNVFPTVPAESLAMNNISYTALKAHAANLDMTIATKNDKGESLALVGLAGPIDRRCDADANEDAEDRSPKPIAEQMRAVRFHPRRADREPRISEYARFAELSLASYQMRRGSAAIWWAVPSVIADPEYPYRKRLKK